MIATAPRPPVTEYPSSDGEPMAETGTHVESIILLHQAVQDFHAARSDVLVASDQFLYLEEGAGRRRAPDVMIVPGVGSAPVDRYCPWEHDDVIPAAVFEFSSAGTVDADLTDKFDDYEELGVAEYFLFDPQGVHLVPAFQGYRLRAGTYRRMRMTGGMLESRLGFKMKPEGIMLRLFDAATGLPIPTRAERAAYAERKATDAERKAAEEHQRADTLQAQVVKLQALLQKHNIPSGNGS